MSKIQNFIADFLRDTRVKQGHKEELLRLTAREFDGFKVLEPRIKSLEDKIERLDDKSNNQKPTRNTSFHQPKDTYNLLSTFSSSDGGMKNLTHDFSDEFNGINYEDFINQCKEEFESARKSYPAVSDKLLRRIEEFAFKKRPKWFIRKGSKKVRYELGWSHPEIEEWYKRQKAHPSKNANYKTNMIAPFKNSIQIRPDESNFVEIIKVASEEAFGNPSRIEVEIDESVESASFYTDVDLLGYAIFKIFSIIDDVAKRNFADQVQIRYYSSKENFKMIEIEHVGSKCLKAARDPDFEGGDINEIKKSLWSLCNYEIRARFSDGAFRKIILSDKSKDLDSNMTTQKVAGKAYPIDADGVDGFTHCLKFY